ncbi:hypothetical protein INT48_001556 [Thamnidium elegans]|uniref:Uncharacterized protein n=1 Tax=Thamnidium elegans TaxID=101142 RepID=A0A8H7SNK9_9FUNG|nr:hypothetical protein INT48_001556 [Thamnidium elegans]
MFSNEVYSMTGITDVNLLVEAAVDSFKNSFKKFLNDYSSPDKRQKLAIEKMRNNVGAVLASTLAQVTFEKRRSGLNRNLKSCTARISKIVYTRIRSPSLIQPILKIMLDLQPPKPQPVPPNKKRTIHYGGTYGISAQYGNKVTLILAILDLQAKDTLKEKNKAFRSQDIKHLPFDQKIHTLVGTFCSNNILNLASPGLIPERFKVEIQKIKKKLEIALSSAANEQEKQLLIRFSNIKSLEDIESLVKSIPLVPQTGGFTFLSLALTKLITLWQSEVLLNHDHKETWFHMQLYGDLLDSAFLFNKNYITKRSECHASTIKYLKKMKKIDDTEKDCEVDLILFNHGYGDMFTREDKCESALLGAVQNDFEKGNNLREKRLLYLKSIIPYKSNINHICGIRAMK